MNVDSLVAAPALETIPKFPYLVAAYIAFFLILFGYLVSIHVRQQKLEREIRTLEKRLSSK